MLFQISYKAVVLLSIVGLLTPPLTTCFTARPTFARLGEKSSASSTAAVIRLEATTTVEPPTREKTDRKTREDVDVDQELEYPDLEYLIDQDVSRELEDPFHILLLGSTFEKPKITVTYVSGSLEYVLGMPFGEAKELSQFAFDEGMSCLGTWPREECLSLGRQLQVRDIVCRVVPYTQGGQRGWQAKDANQNSNDAFV